MKHNGFEYVDLGLPSGTKWARCNIGADKGSNSTFTKYNETDGKTVLDLEDDAAYVNMGGRWHMPSKEQIKELITNTESTWEANYNGSGASGKLLTSNINGNKMAKKYLP
mgnify:CR=1 FL=1